jgi:hypothetical protein
MDFEVDKIVLKNLTFDRDLGNWIANIYYKESGNNFLIETPIMKIDKITMNKYKNPRIKVFSILKKENEIFDKTIKQIEEHICNKLGKMQFSELDNYSYFFKPISKDNIYKFFIPIYRNQINVIVKKNDDLTNSCSILSLSNLNKNTEFKAILYLSHIEIEKNNFYLSWNILQIKLE